MEIPYTLQAVKFSSNSEAFASELIEIIEKNVSTLLDA